MPTTRGSRRRTNHNDVGGILAALDSNTIKKDQKKEAKKKDETPKRFKKMAPPSLTPDSSDCLSELSGEEKKHRPKTLFPKHSNSKPSFPKAISYRLDKGNVDIESDSEESTGDEESGNEDQSYNGQDSDVENEICSEDTSENEFGDSEERDESVVSCELSEPEDDDFINDDDDSGDLQKFSPLRNKKKSKQVEIELDDEYDPDATDEEESDDELDVDEEDDQVVAKPVRKKKANEVEVVAEILQDSHLDSEEEVVVVNEVEENDETDDENSVALENESDTIVMETDDEDALNHDDMASANSMSDNSEEESTIAYKDSGDATAAFEEGSDTDTLSNSEWPQEDHDNDKIEVLYSDEGLDTEDYNNDDKESEMLEEVDKKLVFRADSDDNLFEFENAIKAANVRSSGSHAHSNSDKKAAADEMSSYPTKEKNLEGHLNNKSSTAATLDCRNSVDSNLAVKNDSTQADSTPALSEGDAQLVENTVFEGGSEVEHKAERESDSDFVGYGDCDDSSCAAQQQVTESESLSDASSEEPGRYILFDLGPITTYNSLSSITFTEELSTIAKVFSIKSRVPPKPETERSKDIASFKPEATTERRYQREGSVRRGKWALGSKIGTGSFGVVHVGMNTHTGQLMAVKSIELAPTAMKDIRREIEVLKSLKHTNIVRYLGAERDEKKLHIFQEWVPGGSVTELIQKFGAFSIPVIRSYLQQILTGLAYLHENNILHRDIKGGNVLINDNGIVRLADFGASKRLAHQQSDMMESLTMRGTPYFMAPEVFEEKYGSKADIWSVGCVAFQMASGLPPWKSQGYTNPMSLFLHLRKSEGAPQMRWPENTSAQQSEKELFEAMLTKCFHRESSQRPTARALLSDLFFVDIASSDDEMSCSQGLFSPESKSASTFSAIMSPSVVAHLSKTPKAAGILPRPFMTPPLPIRIRESAFHLDTVSPLPSSPMVDAREWPTWARESVKKCSVSTMRVKSTMIDSLARSEDTTCNNPFGRKLSDEGDSVKISVGSFSTLDGLQYLESESWKVN